MEETSQQKGVAVVQVASLSQYDPSMVQTLKNTIADGATDDELVMLLTLAGKYQLDPFAKEIFFMKMDKKPVIMTSRDGYLAIAHRDPNFDGLQSAAVYAEDTFELDVVGGTVIHKPSLKTDPNMKPVGAWAIAYRKDRRPALVYVRYREYSKNTVPWSQYPSSMIEKVAQVRALKLQFSISGLVTQEEQEGESELPKAEAPQRRMGRPRKVEAVPTESVTEVAPEAPAETPVATAVENATETMTRDIEKVLAQALALSAKPEMAKDMPAAMEAYAQKLFSKGMQDLNEEELSSMLMIMMQKLDALKQAAEAKAKQNDNILTTVQADAVATPPVAETGTQLDEAGVDAMFAAPAIS